MHFFVYVEKVTSYLWAKLYNNLTNSNSLSMLSGIKLVHGRPKMVVFDSGPSFRNKIINKLRELHIDHSPSAAYMASRNGRREHAVTLVKHMLLLNTPRNNKDLQELTQAINSRCSGVPGAGSAYEI